MTTELNIENGQILSPARAYVFLAEPGTAAPTDADGDLPAGWHGVGLTTSDSLQFSTDPQFQDVTSHQSDFPTRQIETGQTATLAVELQQWNSRNIKAVYGGGTITEAGAPGSGVFKYVPPILGQRLETAALIWVTDGGKNYRWVYPRTMQIEGVQTQMQKGQESRLPLSLSVMGDDGVEPWYMLTDDPAFDPAAAAPTP